MPERTTEEVRAEIAVQRQKLDDDLSALQAEIRSTVPFVAAGVLVFTLVAWRMGKPRGIGLLWKLLR